MVITILPSMSGVQEGSVASPRRLEEGAINEDSTHVTDEGSWSSRLRRSLSQLATSASSARRRLSLPTLHFQTPTVPNDAVATPPNNIGNRRKRPTPMSIRKDLAMPVVAVPAHVHRDSLLFKRPKSRKTGMARLEFVLDADSGDMALYEAISVTLILEGKPLAALVEGEAALHGLKQQLALQVPSEENLIGRPLELTVRLHSKTNAFQETTTLVLMQSINGFLDARVHSQVCQGPGWLFHLQDIYGQPFSHAHPQAGSGQHGEEEEVLHYNRECIICLSEERTTLVLPCRHMCLCAECAEALRMRADRCPMCRESCQALMQLGPMPTVSLAESI